MLRCQLSKSNAKKLGVSEIKQVTKGREERGETKETEQVKQGDEKEN